MLEKIYNYQKQLEVPYFFDADFSDWKEAFLDDIQNQGIGSKCMDSLKTSLSKKGFVRLDTDTALNNDRAQHYYEKNGLVREGITRSYERNPKEKREEEC